MSTRSSEPSARGTARRGRTRRAAPCGDEEVRVEAFLERRNVSELQEMWGFWQNGQRLPTRKAQLVEPLCAALGDSERVRSRVKVLSDRPREVLVRLLRKDGYSAGLPDLVEGKNGRELESYEVEAAARALSKRGFVQVRREARGKRRGSETYVVPRDLGDLICGFLQEERRGPREVFSLAGHLGSLPPAHLRRVLRHADEDVDIGRPPDELAVAVLAGLATRGVLGCIADDGLRDALHETACARGGIIGREEFGALCPDPAAWDRSRLQGLLEDCGLGTVTTLALAAYGIDLPCEMVVLFPAVTDALLDAARAAPPPRHDAVYTAGVDLLTDLQQLLNLVAGTPLRVTQGRTIYRAAQHRIRDAFIFSEDALVDRERVFGLVYDLAFGLELVEVTDESRLRLTDKGKRWDAIELTEKVRAVYGRFLEERLPEGRDFHVRRLRRAVAAALALAPAEQFIDIRDVPFRVRNAHLAALEDEGLDEQYKNRFQYTYKPPVETPADLCENLIDYVVSRLYPLGVVDVALCDERPVGVRLTDLGRRLILGERLTQNGEGSATAEPAEDTLPLVVNPDYEVLHFPEGDVNEVAHTLGRFATRTKSERVAHYRITRETVERAMVKGMDAAEILDFLAGHARTPVPQNVAYSIREWAARVRFAQQREGVLLTTNDADAMQAVLAQEDVRRLLVEQLAPTAILLRAPLTDWNVLEALRGLGVYFR